MLNTVPSHFIIVNCKTKRIQNSIISKQTTFTDYTILNACPGKSARCVPPYYTPSTSSPKVIQGCWLVPRLWYGALRVRPVNEPWFTKTGRLVSLAITFATSASSLDATSFIN